MIRQPQKLRKPRMITGFKVRNHWHSLAPRNTCGSDHAVYTQMVDKQNPRASNQSFRDITAGSNNSPYIEKYVSSPSLLVHHNVRVNWARLRRLLHK
jgi:hypothetical protein